jgi:hypothetical protein
MITWFWMNKAFKIRTIHGTLLIWIGIWVLMGFESWWCDLRLLRGGGFGENGIFLRNNFGKSGRSYRYFVVEYHKFYFDILHFMCCFDFIFNKTWNSIVILVQFLVIQRSIDFCNDIYVYIVAWIFCKIRMWWNELWYCF